MFRFIKGWRAGFIGGNTRLPDDFVDALVHHSWRVRHRAQDDEHADGVESESRHFEPDQSQDSQRARYEVAPVSWGENAELEIRSEKMKVSDEENCQPF